MSWSMLVSFKWYELPVVCPLPFWCEKSFSNVSLFPFMTRFWSAIVMDMSCQKESIGEWYENGTVWVERKVELGKGGSYVVQGSTPHSPHLKSSLGFPASPREFTNDN